MEYTLKILLVVGLVAVGTFLIILIGDLLISLISNKGKKNAKSKNDSNSIKT